jgi:hypothetical protein
MPSTKLLMSSLISPIRMKQGMSIRKKILFKNRPVYLLLSGICNAARNFGQLAIGHPKLN